MTSYITAGAATIAPQLVLGYQTQRAARTIVHTIIGRPDPDVTLKPVSLRTGTLELFLLTEADAVAAVDVLEVPAVFAYQDTDLDSAAMSFVVTGTLGIALEDQTRNRWIVSVPYAEVAP